MKKRILVVGGGVTGIICSYFLNKLENVEISLVERSRPKIINRGRACELVGDFCKPGHKIVKFEENIISLFDELGLLYSSYKIKNGLHLKGVVDKFDTIFSNLEQYTKDRLVEDYFRKTRLFEPCETLSFNQSFCEPNFDKFFKRGTAITIDINLFLQKLFEKIININKIYKEIKSIGCKSATFNDGGRILFDFLIFTIPVWEIKKIVWWNIDGFHNALKRYLYEVKFMKNEINNKYYKYDYVYTPYTPGKSIYRFSHHEGMLIAEVNGIPNEQDVFTDLSFLFGSWVLKNRHLVSGHMINNNRVNFINWPSNISAVGKFACWEKDFILNDSIVQIKNLIRRWGLS